MKPETITFTSAIDIPPDLGPDAREGQVKRAVWTALDLAKFLSVTTFVTDIHVSCFKNDGEDTFCHTVEVTMEVRR